MEILSSMSARAKWALINCIKKLSLCDFKGEDTNALSTIILSVVKRLTMINSVPKDIWLENGMEYWKMREEKASPALEHTFNHLRQEGQRGKCSVGSYLNLTHFIKKKEGVSIEGYLDKATINGHQQGIGKHGRKSEEEQPGSDDVKPLALIAPIPKP
eukprot:7400708-Ditylum_brightwellii.AAC.1